MTQTEFSLVHNKKENCHYDHIPFNLKVIRNRYPEKRSPKRGGKYPNLISENDESTCRAYIGRLHYANLALDNWKDFNRST